MGCQWKKCNIKFYNYIIVGSFIPNWAHLGSPFELKIGKQPRSTRTERNRRRRIDVCVRVGDSTARKNPEHTCIYLFPIRRFKKTTSRPEMNFRQLLPCDRRRPNTCTHHQDGWMCTIYFEGELSWTYVSIHSIIRFCYLLKGFQ